MQLSWRLHGRVFGVLCGDAVQAGNGQLGVRAERGCVRLLRRGEDMPERVLHLQVRGPGMRLDSSGDGDVLHVLFGLRFVLWKRGV